MPDILTQPSARRVPAINTESDAPVLAPPTAEATTPPSDPNLLTPPPGEGEPPDPTQQTPPTSTPTEPKKKPWYQRRFDEQAERINAEKARADALAAELEKRKTQEQADAAARVKAATEAADKDPRPDRTQYDDPDKFAEDIAGWTARKAVRDESKRQAEAAAAAATEAQQRNVQEQIKAMHDSHIARVKAAQTKYPDFDKTVTDDLRINMGLFMNVELSDSSAEILYYLGKHPEELKALNERAAKDPRVLGHLVGRLEAKIESAAVNRQISKSPEPIEPIGARADTGPKSPEEESMDEYAARRIPQLQKERKPIFPGRRVH